MTNKSRLQVIRRTMGVAASTPANGRSSDNKAYQVQTQQPTTSATGNVLVSAANPSGESSKSQQMKKPAPLTTNFDEPNAHHPSTKSPMNAPLASPRNGEKRDGDKKEGGKTPKGKEERVRVGYGPIAWIRHSSRQSSRVPITNFSLLSRLPVCREGTLIRLSHWTTGWKEAEVKMVVKSCYALVFNIREKRRKSWGSAPDEEEDTVPVPDRVLVLRGAIINRSANREDFELRCADGTNLQFRVTDARSRDAWVAALDRAVRQGDAQLSDFETYAKLARGHFGTVQLVKHIRTGTALALKTIEMKPKKPEKQYHERAILELLQSGSAGACPFVARLCFAFRDSQHLYLATELASGGDLWALLRKRRRLQEVTCRFISAELIVAVRHVHSHGVLHRDIKLENLLLDGQGHIKLVDFGLSKRLFDPSKGIWDGRTFTVCGTNYYMPPEMLKKDYTQGHGLAADWWQVGCLIYELIAGAPAFYEKGARNIHKKILDTGGAPPFPSSLKEPPTRACVDIVDKFLLHDPLRRLGKGPDDGALDVLPHPFYKEIDWAQLAKRRVDPPTEIRSYLRGENPVDGPASPTGSSRMDIGSEQKSDDTLDEEGIISRAFPESELFDRPMRTPSRKYRRIRSVPVLIRVSTSASAPNQFATGMSAFGESRAERTEPLVPVDLGPYLGYEFAVDDNALADARRGSGLILSRWRGMDSEVS